MRKYICSNIWLSSKLSVYVCVCSYIYVMTHEDTQKFNSCENAHICWNMAILVTFLLLWRYTMSKPTFKRKHLIWGLLVVSEGESMIITAGNMTTGKPAWCWSSSRELAYILYINWRRKRESLAWVFEISKPIHSEHLLQWGHNS